MLVAEKEIKNVHREPHPFVGIDHLKGFIGKTISFVARVESIKEDKLNMKSNSGSLVSIIRFKGNQHDLPVNSVVEIRGIVNKDGSISFGEHTIYDTEFDLEAFEQMLEYYHGMCRDLNIK